MIPINPKDLEEFTKKRIKRERFDNTKDGYENDDIKYAFDYNGLSEQLNNIKYIIAEVCGENDEYPWYWVLQMKDGTFAWATGSCDYTGWDCQSSASIYKGFKSAKSALKDFAVYEYDSRENIKECLLAQIEGRLPFAIYQPDFK